jgi:dTDP-4-dehydrorhamnose 3,5-epimerase
MQTCAGKRRLPRTRRKHSAFRDQVGDSLVFSETALKGAFVIEPEKREDFRGYFARLFCRREFAERGLEVAVAQSSVSFSSRTGTLRGMHYQIAPFEEVKVVRCTMGRIHDVIVDLRQESPTFRKHFAVELSADNHRMLYIPRRFAHGFQTLEDNTEVQYQMSEFYSPEHGRGVRWNDPAFGIVWPTAERLIHERDQNYPDFQG